MAAVIELDLDVPRNAAQSPVPPFHVWLRLWAPRHPVWAGAAVGGGLAVVAALAGLTIAFVRPAPSSPPAAVPSRVVQVAANDAGEVTTAIVRFDGTSEFVSRGEILGTDPVTISNLSVLIVAVSGPTASCQISIDGQVVDKTETTGGPAICYWANK